MTRKHFEQFAQALANSRPGENNPCVAQWAADVRAVMDVLAKDNPRFDQKRFFDACCMYPHAIIQE